MQEDKLAEILSVHERRVLLLTNCHIGALAVKGMATVSNYRALWQVALADVEVVRGKTQQQMAFTLQAYWELKYLFLTHGSHWCQRNLTLSLRGVCWCNGLEQAWLGLQPLISTCRTGHDRCGNSPAIIGLQPANLGMRTSRG